MRPLSSKLINIAIYIALGLAALYAAARWLLPWLWPFLIAGAAAAAMEPAVAYLCRRGLKRGVAAGICALLFLAAALGLLWLICGRAAHELTELSRRLPEIVKGVSATLRDWQAALDGWIERAPEGLAAPAEAAVAGAMESLGSIPGKLAGKLPGVLSGVASSAPSVLLFAVTALIGTYFISASYPDLLHGAARLLPDRFLCRARLLRRDLRRTLGRWLRAQGLMTLITFGVLAAAFLMLGVRYALLLALLTAVIDALPVLGTGTVLLPWAVFDFLTGDVPEGVGLAITYAAVTFLHSSLQAKLLGDQLGLHPLATLAAIYAGWKLWGVWGMVLFPILAVCVKQALPGFRLRRGVGTEKSEGERDDDRSDFQRHRRYGDERAGRHEHPSG